MRIFSEESNVVMEISIADDADQLVVFLKGEMDRMVYGEGIKQIRQAFDRSPRNIVVDCHGLTHVSSGAVAGLSRLRDSIQKEGKALQFANLDPEIAEVLARGGLQTDVVQRAASPRQTVMAETPKPQVPTGRLTATDPRLGEPSPARLQGPVFRGPDLVSEVGRLKQDLALAEADLRAAKEETETAQRGRQKIEEQVSDMKAKLLTIQEENVKLARELHERPAHSEDSPAENDQLRVELVSLRKERDRLREDLANAREQAKTFRDAYAGLEKDLQRMEGLKEKLAAAEDEMKMAKQDLQFAREKLTGTIDLNRSIEEQTQVLQQDLLAARETARRYEAKFTELKRFVSVELG